MENIIIERIKKYINEKSLNEVNASREVMQEITLFALSKTDFFNYASFCGGTCLRISYDLNRASEDLDFSLNKKDLDFSISNYFPEIKKVFNTFGIEVTLEEKSLTAVKSAFLKNDTILKEVVIRPTGRLQTLKIKMEIDSNPPKGANHEYKYSNFPLPYRYKTFDLSSLFAGKIHAILSRNWVKGRDYYDYLFYLGKDAPINMKLLNNALRQTGGIKEDEEISNLDLEKMLIDKFSILDMKEVKKDCERFVNVTSVLENLDNDLLIGLTKNYFCKFHK